MQTNSELAKPTTARAFFEFSQPSEGFWSNYQQLWQHSKRASAFQAPAFLKYLSHKWSGRVATFSCYQGDALMGAVCLLKRNDQWQFLSNEKSDHNQFVFHTDCDKQMQAYFFQQLFHFCAENSVKLVLDYFPEGEQYQVLLKQLQQQKTMQWVDCSLSVCPFLVTDSAEDFHQLVTRSKRLRRNVRRLKGDENVKIEFFEDDTDLDQWINDYCQLHIQRWQDTSTPSRYTDPEAVEGLKSYLLAWIEDGILLRSSIMMEGKRISLNIGLVEKETFIGHGQAYDPSYNSYSPGRTLLLFIGEWMKERGLSRFDMGDGRDPYKTDFSNEDLVTRRISITQSKQLHFLLKAWVFKYIRENARLLRFYRGKVKPILARF